MTQDPTPTFTGLAPVLTLEEFDKAITIAQAMHGACIDAVFEVRDVPNYVLTAAIAHCIQGLATQIASSPTIQSPVREYYIHMWRSIDDYLAVLLECPSLRPKGN